MSASGNYRMANRLALGTVLCGMDYGVDGARRIPATEVHRILQLARTHGLDTLDTAAAYGDSEQVLGQSGIDGWRVVTKLPAIPADCGDAQAWVVSSVRQSLQRLGIPVLHGALLHRPADLLEGRGDSVYAGLRKCQEQGLTRKVGISIYDPEELAAILPRYPLTLIQAPLNVLDRRLRESGWADRLKNSGVELHVRSVFLQGLLLMPEGALPEEFRKWNPVWRRWHEWLHESGVSAVKACLRFALDHEDIDRVIVGLGSCRQLQEILDSLGDCPIPPTALASHDSRLINPSRWYCP